MHPAQRNMMAETANRESTGRGGKTKILKLKSCVLLLLAAANCKSNTQRLVRVFFPVRAAVALWQRNSRTVSINKFQLSMLACRAQTVSRSLPGSAWLFAGSSGWK